MLSSENIQDTISSLGEGEVSNAQDESELPSAGNNQDMISPPEEEVSDAQKPRLYEFIYLMPMIAFLVV